MNNHMDSISGKTKEVDDAFLSILDACSRESRSISPATNISPDAVSDVHDRFKLWAGNIGARHPPKSSLSLEVRLTAAGEVLEQVSDLLDDLAVALDDLTEIIAGNRENRTISNHPTDSEVDDGGSNPAEGKDEADDILDVASECIRSLLKISILIRKASPRDRFAKALSGRDSPFIDQFDITYVAERYPKLDRPESRWLCERFGRGITKRRQFLRYTREHASRVAGGERDPDNSIPEQNTSSAVPKEAEGAGLEAVATFSTGRKLSAAMIAPTNPSTKASTLDVMKLEALKASDATSDADTRSYVSAGSSFLDADNSARLKLPSLAEVRGTRSVVEFECPFCWGVQTMTSESAWRRHAYADLRAYTCTLGKGNCDFTFFTDSQAWLDHEMSAHRRQWTCILCQAGLFKAREHLEAHVQSTHAGIITDNTQLEVLASAGQAAVDAIPAEDCPFCDEWAASLLQSTEVSSDLAEETISVTVEPRQFRRHVALHMEQVALFAIPRTTGDDEVQSVGSQGKAATRSTDMKRATSSRDDASQNDKVWETDPPLHVAAAKGDLDEVKRLLDEGANPHSKGETWDTAMDAALSQGHLDIWSRIMLYAKSAYQATRSYDSNTDVTSPDSKRPHHPHSKDPELMEDTRTNPPGAIFEPQDPDEMLLRAMQSDESRLKLLRLEGKMIEFMQISHEPFMDLPAGDYALEMLIVKLADYYLLEHSFGDSNDSVRIYRTPYSAGARTPLFEIAKARASKSNTSLSDEQEPKPASSQLNAEPPRFSDQDALVNLHIVTEGGKHKWTEVSPSWNIAKLKEHLYGKFCGWPVDQQLLVFESRKTGAVKLDEQLIGELEITEDAKIHICLRARWRGARYPGG